MTLSGAINFAAAAAGCAVTSGQLGQAGRAGSPSVTPLVSSDFKNGIYTINGVSKTLGEVWTENADWGPYSPSVVVPGTGLTVTNPNVTSAGVLTAEAVTSVAGGFVAVMTYFTAGAGGCVELDLSSLPSYAPDLLFIARPGSDSDHPSVFGNTTTSDTTSSASGSHKVAFILSPSLVAMSQDGHVVVQESGPFGGDATNMVGWWNQVKSGSESSIVEKIEFFSLFDYSAADLPALSA